MVNSFSLDRNGSSIENKCQDIIRAVFTCFSAIRNVGAGHSNIKHKDVLRLITLHLIMEPFNIQTTVIPFYYCSHLPINLNLSHNDIKTCLDFLCKFIINQKLKSQIYKSIQNAQSFTNGFILFP